MTHVLFKSDFADFKVRSVIAGISKALLFVETDVVSGHVTYGVDVKGYDNPLCFDSLEMALIMYNKVCD